MNTGDFLVERRDLRAVRVATGMLPDVPPPGQVLMRIEHFALTSNNITYAAFGAAMHYWDFFPAADPVYGRIPVWGFGTVVASASDGVVAGERFFGYFPMSTHVLLEPARQDASGFTDGAAHRGSLHALYNRYLRTAADPGYRADRESLQMLLRPLFATSFLIDDFLADNAFFGATTVILSSASSKTAYGAAFCLKQARREVRVIGLTSPANAAFVRGLGVFDAVSTYDQAGALEAETAVYVDMSGSASVRAAVHAGFGERLKYSCAVGGTHWEGLGGGAGLPGPRPVLFFAPAQVKKRSADWGAEELQRRLARAWEAFMEKVGGTAPWLRVVEARGSDALITAYRQLLAGRVPPERGIIASLDAQEMKT